MSTRSIGELGGGLKGPVSAALDAPLDSNVLVVEFGDDAVVQGRAQVAESINLTVDLGWLPGDDRDVAVSRIFLSMEIEALACRRLGIEVGSEIRKLRLRIFRMIDPAVAIEKAVLEIHSFYPVPAPRSMELVSSRRTHPVTLKPGNSNFAGSPGKDGIRARNRVGFVINAWLVSFVLSTIRWAECDYA